MHKKIDSNIGMSMFGVVYQAGSYWEEDGKRGTSHLMEHLMCKPYEHLYSKMRALGVGDNASTSDNRVAFYCYGLDECIAEISQVILDSLTKQESLWTKEQFDNEKNIVLQEYNDYFNRQDYGALLNFFRKYYNYCDPIGIRCDIEGFTYEDSLAAAKEVFSKPKMIVEVGTHSVKYNGEYADKPLGSRLSFGNYDIELEDVPKGTQSLVTVLRKSPLGLDDASKMKLLNTCIGDGLESPLYQELREKRGLIYGVWVDNQIVGSDLVPYSSAQTSEKNASEVKDVYRELLSKDMSELISEERFDICKQGMLYEKKKADILPHQGVWTTVMGNYNPYENIEDFSYEQALELAQRAYSIDNFEVVDY